MNTQTTRCTQAEHDKETLRVKKATIALMRHPETALFAGCMMMGRNEVKSNPSITAYTNGVDKVYGSEFMRDKCKDDAELRALVLHENLHVALRHCIHGRALHAIDARRAAMAADYVVNAIIVNLKDKALCKLPEGGIYDPKYINWSMKEVFDDLEEDEEEEEEEEEEDEEDEEDEDEDGNPCDEPGGNTPSDKPGKGKQPSEEMGRDEGFDQHGFDEMSAEDQRDLHEKIDRALREGALLAGRLGADIPRVISDILTPKVDWREALRDFISSSCKGKDEYTWRAFNRRQLANNVYLPTVEDETIGELIIAIDTSGSIGPDQLNEFASELLAICNTVSPEVVRVLWWDTRVAGEQLFDDKDYSGLVTMLKPKGGGGTHVSSVAAHIKEHDLKADCVIVLSDGYVEQDIKWDIPHPTLWTITAVSNFVPPRGGKFVFMG